MWGKQKGTISLNCSFVCVILQRNISANKHHNNKWQKLSFRVDTHAQHKKYCAILELCTANENSQKKNEEKSDSWKYLDDNLKLQIGNYVKECQSYTVWAGRCVTVDGYFVHLLNPHSKKSIFLLQRKNDFFFIHNTHVTWQPYIKILRIFSTFQNEMFEKHFN